MLDLLLINSPIHDYSRYPRFASSYSTPVGLLYVATAARRAGYDVAVLDAEAEQATPAQIAERVNDTRPRVAGFNTFSINMEIVERITEWIEPNITVIVGGPHVSSMNPGHFAHRLTRAEILVRNDGERKIVDILKGVPPRSIPGIFVRNPAGSVIATDEEYVDLDELPFPDRNFLATEPYLRDGRRWMDVSISRGCVFTCKFCAGSCRSNGSVYRQRSMGSVREEIHRLVAEHRVGGLQIVDDLPFRGARELDRFLTLIEHDGTDLQWEVNFPLQFLRSLPDDQIRRMSECGIRRLSFGIESGSYRIRRAMGKLAKDEEIVRIVDRLAKSRISTKGYFIIGFPDETLAEMELTVSLAKRLHAVANRSGRELFRPRIFMFKPMPGSALWKQLVLTGHAEEEMLRYADFEIDHDYFKKHAWGTPIRYSRVDPALIQDLINTFYNDLGSSSV